MKQQKQRKSSGFTLVELLLGMSLTILVGGVLYLMQSTGMSTVKKGTTQLLLTSEIRNNMERIVADLRNSKEILEIKPGLLKVRTYKFDPENPDPGEDALVTVTYELEKSGRRTVLWRTENRENPIKLLALQQIDENIFYPYFEANDKASPTGWSYYPFDMISNDSGQRKRISYVQIRLKFTQQSESAELVTSANLRSATSRIRQPNWKFR
jgi:type II secretory pathway pseudopilin PulG